MNVGVFIEKIVNFRCGQNVADWASIVCAKSSGTMLRQRRIATIEIEISRSSNEPNTPKLFASFLIHPAKSRRNYAISGEIARTTRARYTQQR